MGKEEKRGKNIFSGSGRLRTSDFFFASKFFKLNRYNENKLL
jgi:hypothetical protein